MGVGDAEGYGVIKTGFQSLGLQADLESPCAEIGKVARETRAMVRKVNFEMVIHSTSGEEVTAGMSAEQKSGVEMHNRESPA